MKLCLFMTYGNMDPIKILLFDETLFIHDLWQYGSYKNYLMKHDSFMTYGNMDPIKNYLMKHYSFMTYGNMDPIKIIWWNYLFMTYGNMDPIKKTWFYSKKEW